MTDRSGLSDEGVAGGPVRHVPVLLAEVLSALAPAPAAAIVDGTFGAGGYSEAILDAGADVIAHRPRPDGDRGGRGHGGALGGRLRARARRIRRSRRLSPARTAWKRPTASCSTSASRPCSSTRPSAASRSARTGRSTCAWRRGGRAPPMSSTAPSQTTCCASSASLARSGTRRPHRAGHRPSGGRRKPFERTLDLAGADRKGSRPQPRTRSIRRRASSRRCASSSIDELGELAGALFAAERAAEARRAARRRHLPFAGGPHRQALPRRPYRRRRRLAPPAGSRAKRRKLHAEAARRHRRERGRGAAQPARPFGQAALRHAHRRARARRGLVALQAARSHFTGFAGKVRPRWFVPSTSS